MNFELLPVLDKMLEVYKLPPSTGRFKNYLSILKGNSNNDLEFPISGFNPMAKEHIVHKINELKELKAETLIKDTLIELSHNFSKIESKDFKVAINMADDLKGGWTNYYITDFDSKFKLNAFVERGFCIPYFWSSESYDEDLIITRTKQYCYRTIFWILNKKLNTLQDYLNQEKFVFNSLKAHKKINESDLEFLMLYADRNKESQDYNLIFNFFYGDDACKALNYPKYGIKNYNGFDLAKSIF